VYTYIFIKSWFLEQSASIIAVKGGHVEQFLHQLYK